VQPSDAQELWGHADQQWQRHHLQALKPLLLLLLLGLLAVV
jgi:hypothetical protein